MSALRPNYGKQINIGIGH